MSPSAGRFSGRDPIGFEGGDIGMFTFVGSKPVERVDPSGSIMVSPDGPGGTVEPGTSNPKQNCFGASIDRPQWINWPFLGPDCKYDKWTKAKDFVPSGCRSVRCDEVSPDKTPCNKDETELVLITYRWVTKLSPRVPIDHTYACDFHIVGRKCKDMPCNWNSKMDRRECVKEISDPIQSCYDAYPHTKKPGVDLVKKCFCCDVVKIRVGNNGVVE